MTNAAAASNPEQQNPSFWAKAWRATKDFVKGTIYALPMTAISSGAAIGLSLLITNMTGGTYDPLGVSDKFFTRWLGSTVIFAMVGGGLKAYEGWNQPVNSNAQTERTPHQHAVEQHTLGHSRGHELPGAPPFTPQVERTHGQVRL